MGVQYVTSFTGMIQANRLFNMRVKAMQSRILMDLSTINMIKSKQIAENAKFKGTLISLINIDRPNSLKYRVIASAPHAEGIETGQPKERGWISFDEQPLLESWVREKLMNLDKDKAVFFLKRRAVLVGKHGYPFKYPLGLQFMRLGFEHAVGLSPLIVDNEIRKINAW